VSWPQTPAKNVTYQQVNEKKINARLVLPPPPPVTFCLWSNLLSINSSCCCCEDKGDGTDAESGVQEEDFLIQDEIFKSRLVSMKRVSHSVLSMLQLVRIAKVGNVHLYMHPLQFCCWFTAGGRDYFA
jgi:hypothetical protein